MERKLEFLGIYYMTSSMLSSLSLSLSLSIYIYIYIYIYNQSDQSLSCVRLFATPWTAAR